MYECNYSREPVNFRLLGLRLLKKIWILPLGALIGAVIIGGIYYYSRMVIGGGRTYQAETIYYLNFAEDSSGAEYDWVNRYTWSELIHSDFILDYVSDKMADDMTKEEIIAATSATLESDVRYLYTRCVTNDPDLSIKLARAMEGAIVAFGEHHKEFDDVEISRYPEVAVDNSNIRTLNAIILGACIGLFIVLIYWLIDATVDTSIYIPATLEKRYHIPSLGAFSMEEFFANKELMLEGIKTIAFIDIDSDSSIAKEALEAFDSTDNVVISDVFSSIENIERIKKCDGVVLLVKAASHNGKKIERVIEELARLEIPVTAFLLIGEDADLIKKYYRK